MFAGVNAEVLAIVIERRRFPGIHGVTSGTVVREIQGQVIRIGRPLEIRLMAGKTIRRRASETVVHVTLIASRRAMCAQQWKACFAVIEC
jgi:hypothetical protein